MQPMRWDKRRSCPSCGRCAAKAKLKIPFRFFCFHDGQALDKITTSPGGLGDDVGVQRGQQEWTERYRKAFDDLEHMQSSLRRQQQQQYQQQQQQQHVQQNQQQHQRQLIDEHSQHVLAAIQSKLSGQCECF